MALNSIWQSEWTSAASPTGVFVERRASSRGETSMGLAGRPGSSIAIGSGPAR